MKTIKSNIAWYSNEYSDTPTQVILTLSNQDIEKIEVCKILLKQHALSCIRIDVDAQLLDADENETEWRCDTQCLSICSHGIYFYAQSKWDAGDQIETENIEPLLKEEEVTNGI